MKLDETATLVSDILFLLASIFISQTMFYNPYVYIYTYTYIYTNTPKYHTCMWTLLNSIQTKAHTARYSLILAGEELYWLVLHIW